MNTTDKLYRNSQSVGFSAQLNAACKPKAKRVRRAASRLHSSAPSLPKHVDVERTIRALAKTMLDHLIRLKLDSISDLLFFCLVFSMWPQQDAKVQISATSSCARASFHFLRSLLAIYKARATALLPLESTIKENLGSNWRKKLSGSTGWLEVVSQASSWKRWYPEELVQSFSLSAHETNNPTWPDSDVSRRHG